MRCKVIMAINENEITTQQKNVVTKLGDGEVFVKKTPSGEVQAVKANVALSEKKGQLYVVQGKCQVTAEGYFKMNEIANVSIVTPSTLKLPNGDVVVNPYPIIDPVSKSISKVWVKKIAVGLSPIGNLVVTSSTLLYDIGMYFIQDLHKKVQKDKNAGRMCMRPMLTEDDLKKGMFLPLEGELGIWVDINHPDVLKALDTFIQNKLFAERKAQTICERNALKKHPALATITVLPQGTEKNHFATIPVIGYQQKFTEKDLQDIAEKADQGEKVEFNGQTVEIIETSGEVTEEDIHVESDYVDQDSCEDGEIL